MSPYLDAERLTAHRASNDQHTRLLVGGVGGLLLVPAWLIGGFAGVLVAVAMVACVVLLAPRISPEMVMRLYQARPVDDRHGAQLLHLVAVLAERAQLAHMPGLYVVPSATLNAFTSGTSSHSAIAITEGLLRRLSLREVAGVLAHEMSHIRNNDLAVMGLADAMTRLTQAFAYVAVGFAVLNIPAWLLGLEMFSWVAIALLYLAPAASSLLQLALARTREFDADLEAAGLTGDPQGLATALGALENRQGLLSQDLLLPPTRHVPFPSLLRSHPETAERIARLAELARSPDRHAWPRSIDLVEAPMFSLVGLGPAGMAPRRRWPGLWY